MFELRVGSFFPNFKESAVKTQYPVEAQRQVQSQGAKNEATCTSWQLTDWGAGKDSCL